MNKTTLTLKVAGKGSWSVSAKQSWLWDNLDNTFEQNLDGDYDVAYIADADKSIKNGTYVSTCDLIKYLRFVSATGAKLSKLFSKLADYIPGVEDRPYIWQLWVEFPDSGIIEYVLEQLTATEAANSLKDAIWDVAGSSVSTLNIEQKIMMLHKLADCNFATFFEGFNGKIRSKIAALNAVKYANCPLFVMEHNLPAAYRPHFETNIWSYTGISTAKPVEVGNTTIATHDIAQRRLYDMACGFLEKPVSGVSTLVFPWDNVIVAGGSAMRCVQYNYVPSRSSDIDLFVYGKDSKERANAIRQLLKWFESPKTYFMVKGAVIDIYIKDVRRSFQIIEAGDASPGGVLSHFDLTHIQWCFGSTLNGIRVPSSELQQPLGFMCTSSALMAQRERLTRIVIQEKCHDKRCLKALLCGYDLLKTPALLERVDISDIIVLDGVAPTNEHFRKYLREINNKFVLQTTPDEEDMTEAEIIENDKFQLEKIANTNVIDKSPAVAFGAVVLGGGSLVAYVKPMVADELKPANVVVPPGIIKGCIPVKIGTGDVRLSTDPMIIKDISTGDDGIRITVIASPMMITFCNMLRETLFPKFRMRSNAAIALLIDDTIEFTFLRATLARQLETGKTLALTRLGDPINIEEDLVVGDKIQFMFRLMINGAKDKIGFELWPTSAIVFQAKDTFDDEVKESPRVSPRDIVEVEKSTKVKISKKPIVKKAGVKKVIYQEDNY